MLLLNDNYWQLTGPLVVGVSETQTHPLEQPGNHSESQINKALRTPAMLIIGLVLSIRRLVTCPYVACRVYFFCIYEINDSVCLY